MLLLDPSSAAPRLRALLLAGLFSLAAPGLALAAPVTITFDTGYDDTSITDPTGDFHGPYAWIEKGVRVSGFWALDVGTPEGRFGLGHYHPNFNPRQPASQATDGYVSEYTHAYFGDLQGLVITLEDGGTFDLLSVNYDVWHPELPSEPELARLPWSFAASAPQIIATDSFDPSLPDFESQWNAFPATYVPTPADEGNWHTVDFTTAALTGLTSVMISQTAALTWLDNIVIDVHEPAIPTPEPSTALLLGLGLMIIPRVGRKA